MSNYKNFIPQVWSARLLANLDKTLVYGDTVNRDYEGEIKNFGDTVRINQLGNVTIGDYDATTGVGTPEELNSEQTTLVIDQAKYFNFKVEDIDAVQANVGLIDKAMGRASYAIGDVIDKFIAGFYTEATNTIGSDETPEAIGVAEAYDALVDLSVKLDEANVTRQGRFAVVPAFYLGLLSKDPRFTNNFKVLENGVVDGANVAGMQLRMSNNVPVTEGKYKIMAGTDMAISFAGQVTKIEPYRPESQFADAVKGLYVFGAKVVQPDALAVLTATKK